MQPLGDGWLSSEIKNGPWRYSISWTMIAKLYTSPFCVPGTYTSSVLFLSISISGADHSMSVIKHYRISNCRQNHVSTGIVDSQENRSYFILCGARSFYVSRPKCLEQPTGTWLYVRNPSFCNPLIFLKVIWKLCWSHRLQAKRHHQQHKIHQRSDSPLSSHHLYQHAHNYCLINGVGIVGIVFSFQSGSGNQHF